VLSPPLRRFLPYLRPQTHLLAVTVAGSAVSLAAATAIPLLIAAVIDGPVGHGRPAQLIPYAAGLLGLAALEVAANFARRFYSNLASLRMETELRDDFYAHLQGLQVAFHDNWQSGQLLSRAVADIQTVRRFVGFGLMFAAFFGAQWVVVLVVLVRLEWRLALVSALVVLPVALVSRAFFRRYAAIARRVQDLQGDMTTVIEEMATGVRIIKAFGRNGLLRRRFEQEATRLRETNLEAVRVRARTWTAFTLLVNADLALVLLVGGVAVVAGQLTIGGLVAFMTYLFMLIWPLDALGWILAMGEEAVTASTRLAEVFNSRPEIVDRPLARGLARVRGHVRLQGVGFRYAGGDWVLRGLDLAIPAGSSLAIVGQNGAGKTTLAKLLCRLYDPQSGSIEVDGIDLKDLDLASWRRRVTAVFQDFVRFELSLRENVVPRFAAGGSPLTDAAEGPLSVDPADVDAAEIDAILAGALDDAGAGGLAAFDTVLAKGYADGTELSGGQWQRIALARAMAAVRLGAGLVLLDEPTAQLDVRGEAEIFERVLAATRSCTTILVSHRFSTVRHADRIAVLEDGAVVELGGHDELMALRGRYWTMFTLQAQRFESGTPEEGEEEVVFDVLS